MSFRRVGEQLSILDHCAREYIAENASSLESTLATTLLNIRMLHELSEDVSAHTLQPSATDKLEPALAVIHSLADARLALSESVYEAIDVSVRELDKRLRLADAVLRLYKETCDDEELDKEEGAAGASKASLRLRRTPQAQLPAASSGSSGFRHRIQEQLEMLSTVVRGAGDSPQPNNIAEPLYCTCQQPSFGEMVACDEPSCFVEWYHLPCVGLTKKPSGRWVCSRCSAALNPPVLEEAPPAKKRKGKRGSIVFDE